MKIARQEDESSDHMGPPTPWASLSGPFEVVVNLTNRCNQLCVFCYNSSGAGCQEMRDEQVLALIGELQTLKPFNVCFSGGEPLLRQQLLLECATLLSEQGVRLSLATNGMLLTGSLAERLIDSGVEDIQISLDAATAEVHDRIRGRAGAFDSAVEALRVLAGLHFASFSASFTATALNFLELEAIVTLLDRLGVPALSVRPLLLAGRAQPRLLPTPWAWRTVIRSAHRLHGATSVTIQIPDPLSQLFGLRAGSPMYHMEFTATGAAIPSPYFPIVLGHIARHRVSDYWNGGWTAALTAPPLRRMLSAFTDNAGLPRLVDATLDAGETDILDSSILWRGT